MARFAEIDNTNKVLRILVVDDKDTQDENNNEVESVGAKYLSDEFGGTWKRTSYNTNCGVHRLGNTPFRKNHAGIGFIYDETRDAFIPPNPFDSWTLNEDTCQWDSPVVYPDDDKEYHWNEDIKSWDEKDNT